MLRGRSAAALRLFRFLRARDPAVLAVDRPRPLGFPRDAAPHIAEFPLATASEPSAPPLSPRESRVRRQSPERVGPYWLHSDGTHAPSAPTPRSEEHTSELQ